MSDVTIPEAEMAIQALSAADLDADLEITEEPEMALCALLRAEKVFLNTNWNKADWPEQAKKTTRIIVNCSDVFAWACADGEEAHYGDLIEIYHMWRKDPNWGPEVWCMKRRNQMPQKPVEDRIRRAGIWDFDALALGPNTLNAEVRAQLAQAIRSSHE